MGNARNIAFWVVLFLLILALFNAFGGNQSTTASRTVSYSEFIQRVDAGEVASATIDGERVVATSILLCLQINLPLQAWRAGSAGHDHL